MQKINNPFKVIEENMEELSKAKETYVYKEYTKELKTLQDFTDYFAGKPLELIQARLNLHKVSEQELIEYQKLAEEAYHASHCLIEKAEKLVLTFEYLKNVTRETFNEMEESKVKNTRYKYVLDEDIAFSLHLVKIKACYGAEFILNSNGKEWDISNYIGDWKGSFTDEEFEELNVPEKIKALLDKVEITEMEVKVE